MPLDTMASAISRTALSSIFSANLFQLFQPIGGVNARSAAQQAGARSNAKRENRLIFTHRVYCIFVGPALVRGGVRVRLESFLRGVSGCCRAGRAPNRTRDNPPGYHTVRRIDPTPTI